MAAKRNIIRNTGFVGAGAGLATFLLFGLLQGAMLGGTAGLVIANEIFGPGTIEIYGSNLFTRVVVGGGMLTGVIVALIVFLVTGSLLGVACGYVFGLAVKEKEVDTRKDEAKGPSEA